MEQTTTIDEKIKKILDYYYAVALHGHHDAIRDIKALFETNALTPCVNPRVGQKVWVEIEINELIGGNIILKSDDGYLFRYDDDKVFQLPQSPSTRLATMLKNPDDIQEVIKLAKQIEG